MLSSFIIIRRRWFISSDSFYDHINKYWLWPKSIPVSLKSIITRPKNFFIPLSTAIIRNSKNRNAPETDLFFFLVQGWASHKNALFCAQNQGNLSHLGVMKQCLAGRLLVRHFPPNVSCGSVLIVSKRECHCELARFSATWGIYCENVEKNWR